jgi:hypothetical protein
MASFWRIVALRLFYEYYTRHLTNKKELLSETEKYRPWRAYAAMHLWKSLGTKEPIRLKLAKKRTKKKITTTRTA